MFARFDENPAMTLQDIKETKRYGRTDRRTHAQTDNVKTVYPTTNKVCGGYKEKHAVRTPLMQILNQDIEILELIQFATKLCLITGWDDCLLKFLWTDSHKVLFLA